MHTWMDARVAKGRGEMECDAADARGSYRLGQVGGILTERRAAGVGLRRQDGPAVGRRYGRCIKHDSTRLIRQYLILQSEGAVPRD